MFLFLLDFNNLWFIFVFVGAKKVSYEGLKASYHSVA